MLIERGAGCSVRQPLAAERLVAFPNCSGCIVRTEYLCVEILIFLNLIMVHPQLRGKKHLILALKTIGYVLVGLSIVLRTNEKRGLFECVIFWGFGD